MLRVPSVWVTPAPEVSRSEVIVDDPETVVLRLKLSAVSLANCNSPPVIERVPAPKAPALVVARRMPAASVVAPVKVLAPDSVSVPPPLLVSPPAPLMIPVMAELPPPAEVRRKPPLTTAPPTVNRELPLFVQDCAAPRVIPRFALPRVVACAPELTVMPL